MTGIVDAVRVDHQGAGERAQIDEVVPIATVASEPRGLKTEDGADAASAHCGDELLEARPHHQP